MADNRQVAWFETYQYAERILPLLSSPFNGELEYQSRTPDQGASLISVLPLVAGTPQWCALGDDDPRKLLALVLGGVREALSHEVFQEHRAEASRSISTAADWSALAQRVQAGRGDAYIQRKSA